MVRAPGIEPGFHAWEAHVITTILRPRIKPGQENKNAARGNHEYARRPSSALFKVTESA